MKRTLLLFVTLLFALGGMSQSVKLRINDGLPSNKTELKANMEREASKLLTEFNAAARSKRTLNVVGINMTAECKNDLKDMYDFLPFQCDDPVYTEPCIKTYSGYCVRNILVSILPNPDYHDPLEREITINFSLNGQITSVAFSLPIHESKLILQNARDVEDLAKRNEILSFVENYRSFYDKKDIVGLENIFDEDAIIITGTVVYKKMTNDFGNMVKETVYKQQDKPQYIEHLKNNIFKNNKYIRVKFDDIEVARHPTRDDTYIVTLQQDWNSTKYNGRGYHDEGFVTLLWQFPKSGQGSPQILFRSWQSNDIIRGQKDDLFNFDDLNIPPSR